jgi:serine/threonine protein kinase
VRELAERAYFGIGFLLGRLLRASRYSRTSIIVEGGKPQVRKRRAPHAKLLILMSVPLVRLLNAGVRVLPTREWVERERTLYGTLYGAAVREEADGTLLLPFLSGRTLASLMEDRALSEPARMCAIELAVAALAQLHSRGITHGDAMAENVMVDVEAGVARWVDFETVHEDQRSLTWRRADDLRALLTTSLVRTSPYDLDGMLGAILRRYADSAVTRHLAANLASVWRRPLSFHLGQAGLSFRHYRALQLALRTRQRSRGASVG